jgi:hypothetical protein
LAQNAAFCRTQQALQRDRADTAELENTRIIATRAADAWGREAVLAERLESKRATPVMPLLPATFLEEERDRQFSENPDRGNTT